MPEPELKQEEKEVENDFLIEKIKERPVNKKKLLRRTIMTASMAVIFGLIACFTFLVLEPVINNWLYPEEKPQVVVFPEDQEEMSPEEMLSDNMLQENQSHQTPDGSAGVVLEKEELEDLFNNITLDLENYKQLSYALSDYVEELNQYMVTVTGVTSNIDWFNNVEESSNQSWGVVIADNGREILVLADYAPLKEAESLTLTFFNNTRVDAQLKSLDSTTNLAIIAVSRDSLSKEMYADSLKIAPLGSSGGKNTVGMPVVALGSPMGVGGSIGYGIVTAVTSPQSRPDTNYKVLQTDISGSKNATGILFNLNGQVVGVIAQGRTGTDMENMLSAYGITELKKRIEKMSNGTQMAYLGISGVDVSREANEDQNVPYGAYVTQVAMDSPSMQAGIQQGDVLVEIDGSTIFSYNEYVAILTQKEPGQTVNVTVMRLWQGEYKEMEFEIVLGESGAG